MSEGEKYPSPDATPRPLSKLALVRRYSRDCSFFSDHPKYPPKSYKTETLTHAAGGCDECLFALVGFADSLNPTKRTEILRIFLKDMIDGNTRLDDQIIRSYISWCASEALKESFAIHDHNRGIIRRTVTKLDIVKEPGEDMAAAMARSRYSTLGSGMIERTEMELFKGDFLNGPQDFREWFEKSLVLPIVAKENVALGDRKKKVIHIFNTQQLYFDHIADLIRFKTWETVAFPKVQEPVKRTA